MAGIDGAGDLSGAPRKRKKKNNLVSARKILRTQWSSWKTSPGGTRLVNVQKTTADSKSIGKNTGYTRDLLGQ